MNQKCFEPFFRRGMSSGFEHLLSPLQSLGLHNPKARVLHIAGTNGKGSLCHYLRNLFSDNHRCATFTSPHVHCPSERIDLPSGSVHRERLIRSLQKLDTQFSSLQLSFFELSFLAFLTLAREEEAEVLIIEAGLGGLLDSTNALIAHKVNAITSISLDHTSILGHTESEILWQKAGIARPGQKLLIPQGFAMESKLHEFNASIQARIISCPEFTSPLQNRGQHQASLAGLALGIGLDAGLQNEDCQRQIQTTKVPLRQEYCPKKHVFLDVCHNPAGFKSACKTLSDLHQKKPFQRLYLALMQDKDVWTILYLLKPLQEKLSMVYVCLDNARAFQPHNKKPFTLPTLSQKELSGQSLQQGSFVAMGSFFLLEAVLQHCPWYASEL